MVSDLVPRVLSYPKEREKVGRAGVGRVGENPGNEVVW